MTDQPTTWTPERALAMFKARIDPQVTYHDFADMFGHSLGDDQKCDLIAIEALESAAAEIERQKARASGLAADLAACVVRADAAEKEVGRLRAELAAMTQQRDLYCKEMLDAMKATKPAAKEGPSDEEMDRIDHLVYCADPSKIQQSIDRGRYETDADYVKRKTFEALQAMAKRIRRAGVKL